jgi:hypothetical protein
MLNWFNALVSAAVLLILIIAGGNAIIGRETFDPLSLAGAIFLLLALPILFKLTSRRRSK